MWRVGAWEGPEKELGIQAGGQIVKAAKQLRFALDFARGSGKWGWGGHWCDKVCFVFKSTCGLDRPLHQPEPQLPNMNRKASLGGIL